MQSRIGSNKNRFRVYGIVFLPFSFDYPMANMANGTRAAAGAAPIGRKNDGIPFVHRRTKT